MYVVVCCRYLSQYHPSYPKIPSKQTIEDRDDAPNGVKNKSDKSKGTHITRTCEIKKLMVINTSRTYACVDLASLFKPFLKF